MTHAAGSADDSFHPPTTDDPYWTETAWFGFSVPERRLTGAVYPVFRPNQGICSCGVYVWDAGTEAPWEIPYSRNYWHVPMPDADLAELSLPVGLSYECTEAAKQYRIRYRDGDELDLDLTFNGIRAPHAVLNTPDLGHLDQIGHVTGMLALHGEELEVDCLEMRDRSWGIRTDHGPVRAGYSYGTVSTDLGFHAMTIGNGDEEFVIAGFLVRDGQEADLVSGHRHVVRENGRPVRVTIEGKDSLDRAFRAEGTCVNRFAFQSSPNLFAWMSLTRWSLDDSEGFGEDQDVWSPDLLRAASFSV